MSWACAFPCNRALPVRKLPAMWSYFVFGVIATVTANEDITCLWEACNICWWKAVLDWADGMIEKWVLENASRTIGIRPASWMEWGGTIINGRYLWLVMPQRLCCRKEMAWELNYGCATSGVMFGLGCYPSSALEWNISCYMDVTVGLCALKHLGDNWVYECFPLLMGWGCPHLKGLLKLTSMCKMY